MGLSHNNVHIFTQISPNILNLWVSLRDTAEILKIHVLELRLLSNPNKYGHEQLLLSIEYSRAGAVGAL